MIINILTNQDVYEVRRILLLETAVTAKMLAFVLQLKSGCCSFVLNIF